MDILAAFFLTGLILSGLKLLLSHLLTSLDRFNKDETLILHSTKTDQVNLLTAAIHENNRRDNTYMRVTSSTGSNDGIKRMTFPARIKKAEVFEDGQKMTA